MELTLEQKSAVESNYATTVVVAGAGSGKTRVLTERAKFLLNSGVKPENLYMITYTNNAAQEMYDRLSDCKDFDKVFIGTIHSLAAQILSTNKIQLSNIIKKAVETEDFDILFREVQKHLDNLFIPPIEHLLVDEFQDICPNEYSFIKTVLHPENIYVVGDPRQSIYSFKGATPKFFNQLYNDPYAGVFELTENFRNKFNIIYHAQQAIKDLPEADLTETIPVREGKAMISSMSYNLDEVARLLKNRGDFKDWFVLARSNKLLNEIADKLYDYDVPYVTFRQSEKTNAEIKALMEQDVVKLLTIHSSKGLESKRVILFENYQGNPRWSQDERDEAKRLRYVGITRAKDELILVKQPSKRKSSAKSKRNDDVLVWG